MKSTIFIITAICFLGFCAGCSTAQPLTTASPVPPVDTTKETLIEFPTGKFYNGAFDSYLVINANGTWRLLEGTNRTIFTSAYQLEEDQVFFADQYGYCSDIPNSNWKH